MLPILPAATTIFFGIGTLCLFVIALGETAEPTDGRRGVVAAWLLCLFFLAMTVLHLVATFRQAT